MFSRKSTHQATLFSLPNSLYKPELKKHYNTTNIDDKPVQKVNFFPHDFPQIFSYFSCQIDFS